MARETYETQDELDRPAVRDGLGSSLIYLTTLLIVIGFVLVQKGMAIRYNAGMFADKSVVATPPTPPTTPPVAPAR